MDILESFIPSTVLTDNGGKEGLGEGVNGLPREWTVGAIPSDVLPQVLVLRGLPRGTQGWEVVKKFSKFGKILGVSIIPSPSAQPQGKAIILFQHSRNCQYLLDSKMNFSHRIRGSKVYLHTPQCLLSQRENSLFNNNDDIEKTETNYRFNIAKTPCQTQGRIVSLPNLGSVLLRNAGFSPMSC